jgi:hypothetical protein
VSSLRRAAGEPAQQRVVVPLGPDGAVKVATDDPSTLVLDVVGYLGDSGAGFHPVAPTVVTPSGQRLAAGRSTRVAVGGTGAVPRSADAVVLQLSGTGAKDLTRLYVYPAGSDVPKAPDLAVPRRSDRTNLVVVPLGTEGRVRVLSRDASVGVALTVVGWLG